MKKHTVFLLFLILLFGLFLRFYKLSEIPFGFHQDEVVNAYVGKFILKNGFDLYGNSWPIFYFDKWGDYPPVLPMYFSGFGSLIFGNTVFGARFFPALFGSLTILIVFFLVKEIFLNEDIALFSSFVLAINPWHISFSRVGTEGIIALFFYSLSLLFSIKLFQKPILKFKILSFILSLLSFLCYPSYRLIIPLTFFILLIFSYLNEKKINYFFLSSFLCFLIFTYIISQTFWGKARFFQTSIFNIFSNKEPFWLSFIYNEPNIFLARIFNNKVIYFILELLKQLSNYFSFNFLFLQGGNPPWFSFPNSGLFYLTDAFLIFAFLIFFIKDSYSKLKKYLLIFFLLIINIFPAALTIEQTPHTHRSLASVLFFIIFISIGYFIFLKFTRNKRWLLLLFWLLFLGNFLFFSYHYFRNVSVYTAIPRSDGNKQTALYLNYIKNKYQKIYVLISGWFPIYYLYFSNNYSPTLVGKIQKGMRAKTIDNLYFYNRDCWDEKLIKNFYQKKAILVFSSACEKLKNPRFKMIKQINNISNLPIYYIFEFR